METVCTGTLHTSSCVELMNVISQQLKVMTELDIITCTSDKPPKSLIIIFFEVRKHF